MSEPALRGVTEVRSDDAEVIDLGEARRRKQMHAEKMVRKERIASAFDVSTRTVYRWVEQGCPVKRLRGGALRFQLALVQDWHERR